jgi:KaiC/GvpD/RAD55 family RecA-like ATPase
MEERLKTGVKGLDNLIQGGFVKTSVNLVSGPPGTGKTIFGTQFIHEGLKNGETVMLVTLEEGMNKVKKVMNQLNMEPDKYIEQAKLFIFDLGETSTSSSDDLGESKSFPEMIDFINNILQVSKPTRIVIDSLPPLHANYRTNEAFRRDLARFCRFLQEKELTSLLITEKIDDNLTRFNVEEFLCDAFFLLDLQREEKTLKRTFEIRKMRFTQFNNTIHTAVLGPSGLDVF